MSQVEPQVESQVEKDEVRREDIEFASSDGSSTIRGYIWWPKGDPTTPPAGVVQITHGMAEHIGRYDDFARFLARNGYVVAGHDQVGHGMSSPRERWGCIPAANGKAIMVEDVNRLRELVSGRVGKDVPYFVFGHSLGSFITRSYIARHGAGLSGAVICGTGFVAPSTSAGGNFAARMLARMKGEDYKSKFLDNLGVGAYAKAIKGAKTQLDWLSYDEGNIERYMADDRCGFMFSAGGYATVTALTKEVCTKECAARVPAKLPLLFIAGDGDPVGSMGAGVRASEKLAKDAGSLDVTCIIYEHMRHEILNESDHQRVYDDVLRWVNAHAGVPQD